jgi:hypothetical protein
MPPDNAVTVAPGAPVEFPEIGPSDGSDAITWSALSSAALLSAPGTYQVSFQVSIEEIGQLQLQVNGVALAYTVVGRDTGTSQITETALVTTTIPDSELQVINPVEGLTALTITPNAGGISNPVSASLVIERLR